MSKSSAVLGSEVKAIGFKHSSIGETYVVSVLAASIAEIGKNELITSAL